MRFSYVTIRPMRRALFTFLVLLVALPNQFQATSYEFAKHLEVVDRLLQVHKEGGG